MYCPNCLMPNEWRVLRCANCNSDISGLDDRIAVGSQFVFVDALPHRPVALAVDGGSPEVLSGPAVFSLHLHGFGFGVSAVEPKAFRAAPPPPETTLLRLPAPDGPDLTAVISERKIYRPREEARFFILAPDAPGQEVEMEVQLSGQQITKETLRLDDFGLALRPYSDLEEGEYTVLIRRRDRSGSLRPAPARCSFSVAEFALSPLTALLEHYTYSEGRLAFRLRLIALSVPYCGSVELALQSGDRVVETRAAEAQDGRLEATFDVERHEGPFHVQVTTPGGEAATAFFPSTGRTERERATLSPLGRVAEAGLLPGPDTREVRGLHVGLGGVENTPLSLESAVAGTGRLICEVRAQAVQVVCFHPLTGEATAHDFRDVSVGDVLEFPVEAPYTLFTVGLLAPRQQYEAWGVIVRPPGLEATLTAPERAGPGDEIAVCVESRRPAACLLLVYDARLEHESPVPKLARQLFTAIRSGTSAFREGITATLGATPPWLLTRRAESWTSAIPVGAMATSPPRMRVIRSVFFDKAMWEQASPLAPAGSPEHAIQTDTAVEAPAFVAAPSREDFPELAYLELFPVDGTVERTVGLGDQIGTWRCRAYMVSGLDVQELTADVQAAKAVYAELDLPASVSPGDDIVAAVRYHTAQPATLSITLPDGQTVRGAVLGHGAETFHLTGPGEVAVHIAGPEGEDWTTRMVPPPGLQLVTVSSLDILKRGETARAERVVVYPGPAEVLSDTIEALGRYPFG